MRKFVTIDEAGFPIVVAKFAGFVPSTEEFTQMQRDLDSFHQQHSNFVLLVDLTEMAFLPAEFRISQGKWQAKNDAVFVQQKVRLAFCTPSVIAQLMLKGVLILNKPKVP